MLVKIFSGNVFEFHAYDLWHSEVEIHTHDNIPYKKVKLVTRLYVINNLVTTLSQCVDNHVS